MCVLQQVAWTVVLVRTVATDRMETMAKMARMVAMVRHTLHPVPHAIDVD
jgi:hypothetical protein